MVPSYTSDSRPSSTIADLHSPIAQPKSIEPIPSSSGPSESAPSQFSFLKSVALISLCVLGFVVNNISQLAINVILPVIQRDLNIEAADLQWLSGGFSLGYASVLLMAGRLADIYGYKLCLQIGLLIFSGASLGSALSQSSIQLSVFRAIMGLGAAIIAPALLGILGRNFAVGTKMRTAAFAALSAGAPLGAAVGQLVGGFITNGTRPAWRSVSSYLKGSSIYTIFIFYERLPDFFLKKFFYICVAFSLAVAVCATFIVPADGPRMKGEKTSTVDWIGGTLIVAGLALLIVSLATSSRKGWNSPEVLGSFVVSLVTLLSFVGWEAYLERAQRLDPLVKLSIFKRGCFWAVECIVGLLWLAFVVANYFLNLYFQNYLRLPLTQTVIRFIPMLVVGLLLNLAVSQLANAWPAQVLMLIGCVGTTISCLLMALMEPNASYWTFNFFSICLSVIGPGFVFAIGTLYGAKVAGKSEQAVAGGIFHTFAQIGSAIGLSIATIVQVEVTKSEGLRLGVFIGNDISGAPPIAYLKGLRGAFWTCFSSVALATLLSVVFLGKMGSVGKKTISIDFGAEPITNNIKEGKRDEQV